MPRLLLTILLAWVCLGVAHARTLAELEADLPEAAAAPKPRRVLFRAESPRPILPRSGVPVAPKATPVPRSRQPAATPIPVPSPKARIAPRSVGKPPPPQRVSIPTPPRETARVVARADIDFQPTSFTPYDRYLGTVKAVIASLDLHRPSMVTACELVQECRNFRYATSDLYRADPPAVTEARRAGDCKSKALWVYDQLGDPAAYYVIGKLVQRSKTSHAWVYWRNNGRWWILDPTVRSAPIAADSVSPTRYVPYYSFSRAGAFRHNATRIMLAAGGIPAVTPTAAVRERPSAPSLAAERK